MSQCVRNLQKKRSPFLNALSPIFWKIGLSLGYDYDLQIPFWAKYFEIVGDVNTRIILCIKLGLLFL